MRRLFVSLCLGGAMLVSACENSQERQIEEAVEELNILHDSRLAGAMLNTSNPDEAVNYFKRAVATNPERIDLMRGLAISQIRAGNTREGVVVWKAVTEHPEAEDSDHVAYADALIRQGEWDQADAVLDAVPPTHETYERYRLEAMIADSNKEWTKADSFYETAVGLTTRPAPVLNNWGLSKMTRGDNTAAERLFVESLRYDPNLFSAKNHLVMARASQRNYTLPVLTMTQTERAMLLFNMGLMAVRQGDTFTAKQLFQDAIESHPQHFPEAVRALEALEQG